MENQPMGNHGQGIFWCGRIWPLGPLLQGETRIAKLKMLITHLLLVLEVCSMKPTYRKSCWESFDVVRFDLGPFLRGQTRIAKSKVLINRFFLALEACNVKPSYRKSCARNLLM